MCRRSVTQLGNLALINRYCRDVVREIKAHMFTFPRMTTIADVQKSLSDQECNRSITRIVLPKTVVKDFWAKSFDERIQFLQLLSSKFGLPESLNS